MKISGIDFPKSLLNAQRNNQLVVFCGAGVSMPQPAGLSTFRQLAKAVALGSGETLGKDEPEDRFLGRLAHKGQQVHLQAAEVIRKNVPKPSCLHHDLTALYRNPDSLRIVTTNFDTLFEEAAKERFGTEQKVFRAPALPLGRDFNGIVHVHGSIDSPNDMILTDADFRLRGSLYLGQTLEQRRQLVGEFREIYRCRSSAVHEGTLPDVVTVNGESAPIGKFINSSQNLFKRCLLKVIESGEWPDWTTVELGGGQEAEN